MNRCRQIIYGYLPQTIGIVAFIGLLSTPIALHARTLTPGGSGDTLFPVPPEIQANVKFWEDIFSRYKISEVVFHDEYKVDRIYEVMDLGRPWVSDGSQKRKIRHRERRIQSVLRALAYGRTPPGREARLTARIRKMYQGESRSALRGAISQVRAQPGLKERFRDSYIRSGKYLPHFQKIFRKYQLPIDLTLLPHVESGFRSSIHSHAGASGMWQFTRSTARHFMRVDRTIDGRRDPYISADAAAKLFKRNYEDLKNWPLAITAYNHGAVGIRRAVRRVGSRDIGKIVKRYNSRTFGFASRNFYAEFIAAVRVHKDAQNNFGNVRPESPSQFSVFHLPEYIQMRTLVGRIGIDFSVLSEMNPALRPSILRGSRRIPRGYPLRVPTRELVRARTAYYQKSNKFIASNIDENSKWVWIRSGDTLGRLARRFGVTVSELKIENHLDSNLIVVGDRIRIPVKNNPKKAEKRKLVVASRKEQKNSDGHLDRLKVASVATSKKEKSGREERGEVENFEVKKSSNLNSPAEGPKVAQNRESSWTIPVGTLAQPLPERGSQLRKEALRQVLAVRPTREKTATIGWIRVQENETIGHFSKWLQISPRVIRRMNKIRSSRNVRLGRKIRIPFRRVSRENFMEKRISYHLDIQKDYLRKNLVSHTDRYRLKSGENVWTLIMQTYKVPLWLFRRYNPEKDLHRISAGEELIIPIVEPRSF